jgi:hypothetical protein
LGNVDVKLHAITRKDGMLAALAAGLGLALYVRTLAPDLLLGDSGEFQMQVHPQGVNGHAAARFQFKPVSKDGIHLYQIVRVKL